MPKPAIGQPFNEALDVEEEDEETPEPEPAPAAPPPAAAYAPTPPVAAPAARRRKADANPSTTVGMGSHVATVEGPMKWINPEADLMWGEILEYCAKAHRSPHEIGARLFRVDGQETHLGNCAASEILGDGNIGPVEALFRWVVDKYHLVGGARGPCLYWVQFYWIRSGKILGRGRLQLASPEEIIGQRRAAAQQAGQAPPPVPPQYAPPVVPPQYAPPWGYGPPPGYPGWSGAPYPPAPQPQPAPAPAPPPVPAGMDPQVAQMMQVMQQQQAALAYTQGALQEALAAAREGRQPNIQPPPPPAPPPVMAPQPLDEERIVRRVIEALTPVLRPPQGVAAPPPPPPAVVPLPAPAPGVGGFADGMQRMLTQSAERMMSSVMKRMEAQMAEAITGAAQTGLGGLVEDPDGDPDPEPAPPPPNPAAMLPFDQIPMEARWSDGRPVYYPRTKSDGSIDYLGAAFANPFLLEKVAEGVGALATQAAAAIQRVSQQAAPRPPPQLQQPAGMGAPAQVAQVVEQPPPASAPPQPQQSMPAVPVEGWPAA